MPPITPFPNATVALRTIQIIAACLMIGLTTAAIIFSVVAAVSTAPKAVPAAIFFAYVGLAAAFMQTLASFFLRGWLLSPDRLTQLPVENWEMAAMGRFRTATIVCMALCEAGGFLLLVFTLMATLNGAADPVWFAAVLIPLFGMAMHFPTQCKWEQIRTDARRAMGLPVEG